MNATCKHRDGDGVGGGLGGVCRSELDVSPSPWYLSAPIILSGIVIKVFFIFEYLERKQCIVKLTLTRSCRSQVAWLEYLELTLGRRGPSSRRRRGGGRGSVWGREWKSGEATGENGAGLD